MKRTLAFLLALCLGLLAFGPAVAAARDRDRDRLPDRWERRHGLSPKHQGTRRDPDRDGLANRGEYLARTHPRRADTDRNGVTDANEDPDRDGVDNGNERRQRTHPRRPDTDRNGVIDGFEDPDRDGLNNMAEDIAQTHPLRPDTDGNGVLDGQEPLGKVTAFDGNSLQVAFYNGQSFSGLIGPQALGCQARSLTRQSYEDDGPAEGDYLEVDGVVIAPTGSTPTLPGIGGGIGGGGVEPANGNACPADLRPGVGVYVPNHVENDVYVIDRVVLRPAAR